MIGSTTLGCGQPGVMAKGHKRHDGRGAGRSLTRGPTATAVAGGVVVANEGRRGRRAKLMGETPADEDGGSAEGGRWQVGRRERRGLVSVVDLEELWGGAAGRRQAQVWHETQRLSKNATAKKARDRAK